MCAKMWKELEKLYKSGRIRAIGVSNFLPPHIEYLKRCSDIVPAVNQIEISPLNTQKETIRYCQERGIAVEAMSTFSHYRSNEPRKEIIDSPLLKKNSRQPWQEYGSSGIALDVTTRNNNDSQDME